jgi:hypothetical protein
LGIFCLSSGALVQAAIGPYLSSEHRLLALIRRQFKRGDVLLGDRGFFSFTHLALCLRRGVDCVLRSRHADKIEWKKGRRVTKQNPHDVILPLSQSKVPSRVLGRWWWARLPTQIEARYLRVRVEEKGYRVKELVIVTTLLDPVQWPSEVLIALFRRRWQVELYFDELKTTMKADMLRGKSPEIIERELIMHAIAYNLIRRFMLKAALAAQTDVETMSYKGCLDALNHWSHYIASGRTIKIRDQRLLALLNICGRDQLPRRPHRQEPRCVKRRPKNYQRLTQPRQSMRETPHRSRDKARSLSIPNP